MTGNDMRGGTSLRKRTLISVSILVVAYFLIGTGLDLLAPHLLACDTRTVAGEEIVLTPLGWVFLPALVLTEALRQILMP